MRNMQSLLALCFLQLEVQYLTSARRIHSSDQGRPRKVVVVVVVVLDVVVVDVMELVVVDVIDVEVDVVEVELVDEVVVDVAFLAQL